MFEGIPTALLDNLSVVGIIVVFGLLVITDRLVWHTRLTKAEARADRWEGLALKALGVAEKLTVTTEVTTDVLTKLPDPPVSAP